MMWGRNHRAIMNRFDGLYADQRALANEYGYEVVALYRGKGLEGEKLKEACERHRVSKQSDRLRETENIGRDIARRMQSRGRSIR